MKNTPDDFTFSSNNFSLANVSSSLSFALSGDYLKDFSDLIFDKLLISFGDKIYTPLDKKALDSAYFDYEKSYQNDLQKRECFKEVINDVEYFGGLRKETYEKDLNTVYINSFVREFTNQFWGFGGELSSLEEICYREDLKSLSPPSSLLERFPKNIISYESTPLEENLLYPGFEGTLFQREFDESNMLKYFRIFHQGHRNAFHIKTVNLSMFYSALNNYLKGDFTLLSKPDLLLTPQMYSGLLSEFNKKYEGICSFFVENNMLLINFFERPKVFFETTTGLLKKEGIEFFGGKMQTHYITQKGTYENVNFRSSLVGYGKEYNEGIRGNTVIYPFSSVNFFRSLFNSYIKNHKD